jgi:hypothetical protein
MGKDKSAKRNTKLGKLKDLPTKTKRAAAVKGGDSMSVSPQEFLAYVEQKRKPP